MASELNSHENDKLVRARSHIDGLMWPLPSSDWAGVESKLGQSDNVLEAYSSKTLLANPEYTSPEATALKNSLLSVRRRLTSAVDVAFQTYDHFGDTSFFDVYPVDVPVADTLDKHYDTMALGLENVRSEQIVKFAENYPREILGPERWQSVSDIFIARRLKESGGGANLKSVLRTLS